MDGDFNLIAIFNEFFEKAYIQNTAAYDARTYYFQTYNPIHDTSSVALFTFIFGLFQKYAPLFSIKRNSNANYSYEGPSFQHIC